MNRLSGEKSPYLLQHADNPVNWYSWGDAAFEAARRAGKPIFLSVGYSTCHWCHVMAHESFEDARVAGILNEHFVSIKVDREERPDVDRMYMTFVQATTGSGGWPMSVWLTPDLLPFHGGTYFPPASRWGRPGFVDLLAEIARLWRDDRSRVLRVAAGIGEHLTGAGVVRVVGQVPEAAVLDAATLQFLANFDHRHGGFGGAPKFPRPAELIFLLREHRRTDARAPLDAVDRTLRAMAAGGIRDHLGGGFHRYSVDAEWRVPHFEKMLYDQAQLALAYLEAAQASGDAFFADVAEDTLRYVQREMTDAGGGLFSAEDADSLAPGGPAGGHKSEGAFYLWAAEEIDGRLGVEAGAFGVRFGVRPDGNALEDPQGEFAGRNILYQARPVDEIARDLLRRPEEVAASLGRSRQMLFEARAGRPRPALDDKVLTAWNGLMIAAFARASRVVAALGSVTRGSVGQGSPGPSGVEGSPAQSYLAAARRAACFIRDRMWNAETGRLLRRYRDGEAAIDAFAEDYAGLIFGLLELFQADGDPAWLDWAMALQQRQDELFWDDEAGGWFSTTGRDPSVLVRVKDDNDGAEPAASSISACNLLVLSCLGAAAGDAAAPLRPGAAERVEKTLALFAERMAGAPRAVPMMLAALSSWHAGLSEIVVVGPRGARETRALVEEIDRHHLPFAVVVCLDPGDEAGRRLVRARPWLGALGSRDGRATAYVCRDFTCQAPATSVEELRSRLENISGRDFPGGWRISPGEIPRGPVEELRSRLEDGR